MYIILVQTRIKNDLEEGYYKHDYSLSMTLVLRNIVPSKRTYDNDFKFVGRRKQTDSFDTLTWNSNTPYYFKGKESKDIFTLALNLYLNVCSQDELNLLIKKMGFVHIEFFHNNSDSTIDVENLPHFAFPGMKNPRDHERYFKNLQHQIPVEIEMGSFWFYLGVDRDMMRQRRIEDGWTGYFSFDPLKPVHIPALELYERTPYPEETTEDKIRAVEEREGIRILRVI